MVPKDTMTAWKGDRGSISSTSPPTWRFRYKYACVITTAPLIQAEPGTAVILQPCHLLSYPSLLYPILPFLTPAMCDYFFLPLGCRFGSTIFFPVYCSNREVRLVRLPTKDGDTVSDHLPGCSICISDRLTFLQRGRPRLLCGSSMGR